MFLATIASVMHVFILPFIDLTLMACNASTGIITSMILSTQFLDEFWTWKYDFTAAFFIILGSTSIVLNAHTEKVSYTMMESWEVMTSARTIFFALGIATLHVANYFGLQCYLKALRRFEVDVDYFDDHCENRVDSYDRILPQR